MLDQCDPLELLAQDALVPVVFPYGATGLARALDPGSPDFNLKPGSQVSVPLWMIKQLHPRNMVQVKTPGMYSERYQRKLNAGAEVINLKRNAPYFYDIGNQLNMVLRDTRLSEFLSKTFRVRYQNLVSKGLNTMTGQDMLSISSLLSTEEAQLFEAGRVSITKMDSWWRGDSSAGSTSAQAARQLVKRPAEAAAGAAAAAAGGSGAADAQQQGAQGDGNNAKQARYT